MDIKYINPFIQSAIDIIHEVCQITVKKKKVFIKEDTRNLEDIGILIELYGDVSEHIIFEFKIDFANLIYKKMMGIEEDVNGFEDDSEMFVSSLSELGNQIIGKSLNELEHQRLHCNINPPKYIDNKSFPTIRKYDNVIAVQMETEFEDFFINIASIKEEQLGDVRLLLYGLDESLTDEVIFTFLPKGIEIYQSISDKKISKFIDNKNINLFLFNYDALDTSLENFLKNSFNENKNVKTIIFTKKEKEKIAPEVTPLVREFNITSIITGKTAKTVLVDKLKEILSDLGFRENERRKQIRVVLDAPDVYKINISLEITATSEKTIIKGYIINLSLGGLACRVSNFSDIKFLRVGQELKDVQLILDYKRLLVSGVIVYIKDDAFAIKYKNISYVEVNTISKVMFDKLSECEEAIC